MRETLDFKHFGEMFENQPLVIFRANATIPVVQILRHAHTHLVIGFAHLAAKRFFELVNARNSGNALREFLDAFRFAMVLNKAIFKTANALNFERLRKDRQKS